MWTLMVGIMILGIIIAGNYFSSLRDVARFSTISRELALIDNADNRLNILFDAKIARRDFSIANADMRGIYQVLQALQKDKIIDKIDSIEIYRHGEINSKQIFKNNKNTSFTYITTKFRGKYEIFTKKFEKENGKIMLEYDIIDGNEVINSINLEIQMLDN